MAITNRKTGLCLQIRNSKLNNLRIFEKLSVHKNKTKTKQNKTKQNKIINLTRLQYIDKKGIGQPAITISDLGMLGLPPTFTNSALKDFSI